MTVGQLENTMSARELEEWMALDKVRFDHMQAEQEKAERMAKARAKHKRLFGTDPF